MQQTNVVVVPKHFVWLDIIKAIALAWIFLSSNSIQCIRSFCLPSSDSHI